MSRRKRRTASIGEGHAQIGEPSHWRVLPLKFMLWVVAATLIALQGSYVASLTDLFKHTFFAGQVWVQDRFFPMPDNKLIGVDLRFAIPNNVDRQRSYEGVSVTLNPARCKRPEGESIIRPFDNSERNSYTNAVIHITCRVSGRTMVALTPESGDTQIVYDSVPKDGEQIPFPGIPGSYYAGVLSLYLLDTKIPEGHREPVNKCQITDSCPKSL